MASCTIQTIHPNALEEDYYFHVYMYLTYGVPEDEVDMAQILCLSHECCEDGHYALAARMSYYARHGEDESSKIPRWNG